MVAQWMALSKMKEIAARKEVALEKKDENIFQRFVVDVIRVVALGLAKDPSAQGSRRRGGENLPYLEESVCASKARTRAPTVVTRFEVSLSGYGSLEDTCPVITLAS